MMYLTAGLGNPAPARNDSVQVNRLVGKEHWIGLGEDPVQDWHDGQAWNAYIIHTRQ